jgi:hypothetical protein
MRDALKETKNQTGVMDGCLIWFACLWPNYGYTAAPHAFLCASETPLPHRFRLANIMPCRGQQCHWSLGFESRTHIGAL